MTVRLVEPRTELQFWVAGIPVPQGPTNPAQRADGGRLMAWRDAVAMTARGVRRGWPTVRPPWCVTAALTFRIRQPRSGPWAEATHAGYIPDLDKAVRAVFDALETAGIVANDSQVVELATSKHWARPAFPAGVLVVVQRLEDA